MMPEHPLFAALAPYRALLAARDLDRMSALLAERTGGHPSRFAAQTAALIGDGLHYEQRIAERGVVATREASTHDLFNAAMWLAHPRLKQAMNVRQAADVVRVGAKQRTRGQCALTHFDEAGAIVWVDGADLVAAWDAHDWHALFGAHRDAWGARIALTIVGHALCDYALTHRDMPVAKALAVRVDRDRIAALSQDAQIAAWPAVEAAVAADIATGRLLADPQELRPLPLAGVPGWALFDAGAPCFRPLRPGRTYPAPQAPGGQVVGRPFACATALDEAAVR